MPQCFWCPAAAQVPAAGLAVRMIGWGATSEGGATSDKLMVSSIAAAAAVVSPTRPCTISGCRLPCASHSAKVQLLVSSKCWHGLDCKLTAFLSAVVRLLGSSLLQQVDVKVVAKSVCNGASSYNGAITASMLCAGEAQHVACVSQCSATVQCMYSCQEGCCTLTGPACCSEREQC